MNHHLLIKQDTESRTTAIVEDNSKDHIWFASHGFSIHSSHVTEEAARQVQTDMNVNPNL